MHHVLISTGVLSQADYTRALADFAGVDYIQALNASCLDLSNVPKNISDAYRSGLCVTREDMSEGKTIVLAAQSPANPSALKKLLHGLGRARQSIYLVSQHQLRHAINVLRGSVLTKEAIFGLENSFPGCSARKGLTVGQWLVLGLILIALASMAFLSPYVWILGMSALLSVMFFFVVWLRLMACAYSLYRPFVPNSGPFKAGVGGGRCLGCLMRQPFRCIRFWCRFSGRKLFSVSLLRLCLRLIIRVRNWMLS